MLLQAVSGGVAVWGFITRVRSALEEILCLTYRPRPAWAVYLWCVRVEAEATYSYVEIWPCMLLGSRGEGMCSEEELYDFLSPSSG